MAIDDFQGQIESDIVWRNEELRFLRNQIESAEKEEQKTMLCRASLVILYSHAEGATKFATELFLRELIKKSIPVKHLHECLRGTHLNEILIKIEHPKPEDKFFKVKVPEGEGSLRSHRLTEFVLRWEEIQNSKFDIRNTEDVISTESNLTSKQLRKILYRFGLPVEHFNEYEDTLDNVLNKRNPIAHGQNVPISPAAYKEYEGPVIKFMDALKSLLVETLTEITSLPKV